MDTSEIVAWVLVGVLGLALILCYWRWACAKFQLCLCSHALTERQFRRAVADFVKRDADGEFVRLREQHPDSDEYQRKLTQLKFVGVPFDKMHQVYQCSPSVAL